MSQQAWDGVDTGVVREYDTWSTQGYVKAKQAGELPRNLAEGVPSSALQDLLGSGKRADGTLWFIALVRFASAESGGNYVISYVKPPQSNHYEMEWQAQASGDDLPGAVEPGSRTAPEPGTDALTEWVESGRLPSGPSAGTGLTARLRQSATRSATVTYACGDGSVRPRSSPRSRPPAPGRCTW